MTVGTVEIMIAFLLVELLMITSIEFLRLIVDHCL